MKRLLLLAGSGEARDLARAAARLEGLSICVSCPAEPCRVPPGVEARSGGFGGDAPFRDFLRKRGIDAVLDATHPFARVIPQRAARICAEEGIAHLRLLRPAWRPAARVNWHQVMNAHEAAQALRPGEVVFVASGRETLPPLCDTGARIICRVLEPPEAPFPFDGGRYLLGAPPFSVEDELVLFRDLGIETLMLKNAGGSGSRSKLDAADAMGLRVLMLRRPAPPEGAKLVERVEEALQWLSNL